MLNEEELEVFGMCENVDHDNAETEICNMKAEIEKRLRSLNELSAEEKVIMEKIQKTLEKHDCKYSYNEDTPKYIGLEFNMENKPFKIHIILQNEKVIFRLSFPFRVQTNAYPLMCMFMAEFNENKAFSLLNLDPKDGEVTMEYSYMLENPEQFNEKHFWVYMTSLIYPALENYAKVAHLSVGMVGRRRKNIYRKLLEMALETVNGDFDAVDVSYGIESLKVDSLSDFSNLFRKNDIDRFMHMDELAERNSEEEIKEQTNTDMFSVFAKRYEHKNPKMEGGDEDEQANFS